jgi:hypothetical protein
MARANIMICVASTGIVYLGNELLRLPARRYGRLAVEE